MLRHSIVPWVGSKETYMIDTTPSSVTSTTVAGGIRIASWNLESLRRFFEVLKHVVGEETEMGYVWKGEYIGIEPNCEVIPRGGDTLKKFVNAYNEAIRAANADVICVQEGLNNYRKALECMCSVARKRLQIPLDRFKTDSYKPPSTRASLENINEFELKLKEHFTEDGKGLFKGYTCVVCSGRDSRERVVDLFYNKIYGHGPTWKNWEIYGTYGRMRGVGEQTDQIHIKTDSLWKLVKGAISVKPTKTPGTTINYVSQGNPSGPYIEYDLVPRSVVTAVVECNSYKVVVGCTHVSGGRFEDVNALSDNMTEERGKQAFNAANEVMQIHNTNNATCSYLLGDFNAAEIFSYSDSMEAIQRQVTEMEKVDPNQFDQCYTQNNGNRHMDTKKLNKLIEELTFKYNDYITAPFTRMSGIADWELITSKMPYPTSYFNWPVDHCWVYKGEARSHTIDLLCTTHHAKFRIPKKNVTLEDAKYWNSFKEKVFPVVMNNVKYNVIWSIAKTESFPITDHSMVVVCMQTPINSTPTPTEPHSPSGSLKSKQSTPTPSPLHKYPWNPSTKNKRYFSET